MGTYKASAVEGRDAARSLHESARREQRRVEMRKHGQLAKGAPDRGAFEEFRRRVGGEKQHGKP